MSRAPTRRRMPVGEEGLRAVYDGEVLLTEATAASLRLAEAAQELLRDALGAQPREAQHHMPNSAFFEALKPVRRALFCEPAFHRMVAEVIEAAGLSAERFAFDPARLRVVKSGGGDEPAARAVYHPHRDTWYAHPMGAIAWWIPLDDLGPEETFEIYPEWWSRPVPNDSEVFDYGDWVRDGWELKIGWQKRDSGLTARYPTVTEPVDGGEPIRFGCRRGDNLLFAGAHFHRTLDQRSGRTRFSLDFRAVHLDHHAAGLGPRNVDGRSSGSALVDYVRGAT